MKFKTSSLIISLWLVGILTWKVTADNSPTFGDPFANLTNDLSVRFFDGKDEFTEEEDISDGLGPVFNDVSCAACHSNPAVGGDSDIVETRFGTITHNQFDPLTQLGGSLIQSQGIGPANACFGETIPTQATIQAGRKTPPLFGLGLVDNVPDSLLQQIAKNQKQNTPDIAGRPNMVKDPASGHLALGRFGWKAQVATLMTFSGDAYLNEMGITNPLFPTENAPQGDASLLAICDTVADPEDDGSGIQAFADFMSLLAPPPRGPITQSVLNGEGIFSAIGCAACHMPTLQTCPNPIKALDSVTFHPFSDFLLHDMGSLGDRIEQGQASGTEMRTAPLWGLRVRKSFLHDARATKIEDAILAHDGQGRQAKNKFSGLNSKDKHDLIAFLNSL